MRSSWKVKYLHRSYIRMILNRSIFEIDKILKIFVRQSSISNFFVNKEVYIYNGLGFKKILILKRLLGMKFGEFSFTKRMGSFIHNNDDN